MMLKACCRSILLSCATITASMTFGYPSLLLAQEQLHAFDIPAQELDSALRAFARASLQQVVFEDDAVKGKRSVAVKGEFTARDALDRLLGGSGMKVRAGESGLLIVSAVTRTSATWARRSGAPLSSDAQAAGVDSGRAVDASQHESFDERVEEIVVTAQKRAERIQDVPISITAVTSEDIDRRGLVSSSDYLRGIPGVNQIAQSLGESITIRGIETTPEQQNFSSGTTVATYFGETSTSNTAGVGGGTNVDIKLVDIERVEVLRGPQGTSFGNSSLGGAVRTIPAAPRTDRIEGKVAANYSVTSRNGNDSAMIQGAGNLPLVEGKVAIRAAAYRFEDSGYYRNVAGSDQGFLAGAAFWGAQDSAVDQQRVGDSEYSGGRISALIEPTENLKLTLSHLTQSTEADSSMHAGGQTNASAYDQALLALAPEDAAHGNTHAFYNSDIDLSNATLDYDFGSASLVATVSRIESNSDHAQPIVIGPVPWTSRGISDHTETSGEVRLTTHLDGAWNFLGGLYAEELEDDYTEDSFWYGSLESEPLFLGEGVIGREVYLLREQRNLKQKAAFGEASWRFLPKWTLTGGARYYEYDRTGTYHLTGLFGEQRIPTNGTASGTSFRGNLSYKPSDDVLIYAGYAEGFRLGKPQPGLPAATCDADGDGALDGTANITLASTRDFKSDEIKSYELGTKFSLLERRLSIAADVFSIDWTGVPFRVRAPCGLFFNSQAGGARSEGVELQATFHVTRAIELDVGGAYIDADLSKDAPLLPAPAFEGDRLPGSPRISANLALEYEFDVIGHEAVLRADSIYVGSFYGDLATSADTRAGDYVKVDLMGRVTIQSLSVDLFVKNLTNADEFTYRGAGGQGQFFGYRLRPRTVGLQLSYNF